MRRIKYLFTVPEGEKVTEKHFRRVLTSSIISIVLCMSCLFSTTWAWFEYSLEVGPVTIEVADAAATMEIYKKVEFDDSQLATDVTPATDTTVSDNTSSTESDVIFDERVFPIENETPVFPFSLSPGDYKVIITAVGKAASYATIEIGGETYYSGNLNDDVHNGELTFYLKVNEGTIGISFSSYWDRLGTVTALKKDESISVSGELTSVSSQIDGNLNSSDKPDNQPNPEKPVQPETPIEPDDTPIVPETPSEPDTPVVPETPQESESPENPESPSES